MTRADLVALALVHLDVPRKIALDLADYALDSDPDLGVDRALLAIRCYCRRGLAADTRTVAEAAELISQLSDRCAMLERYILDQERDAVEPLRPRARQC